MNFIRNHFPKTKASWKAYAKIFFPIIAGSVLFALNGVVDNFMVGQISQGVTSLGAINSWTNILTGWFMGTAAAGSVVMAQFYHAGKFDIVKQIARYRFWLCAAMAIVFAIVAWSSADTLTNVFYTHATGAGSTQINNDVMNNARTYAHVIAIQWILISFAFNYGNQLRELGYGKFTMIWGIFTLGTNITLNATLMYGFGMGVEGAAWASVAGRIVAISAGYLAVHFKKIHIGFAPWSIFQTSLHVRKLFWKRWVYFLAIFTGTFFVTFRNHFYGAGFPAGGLGTGVSGLSVVGLTASLMSVFNTTFSALVAMSAVFVGSELGKGNLVQAKINANELKGFNTLMAFFMSVVACIFATCVPYLSFLSQSKWDASGKIMFDSAAELSQVRNAMYVMCFFYPIWIWFSTSYRVGNSGGKGGKFALVDWIVSGPVQMCWLAIITLVIIPASPYLQAHFYLAYVMFYVSDLLKLLGQEILFYRYEWLHSITHEKEEILYDIEIEKEINKTTE